jgi:hypothetical protein
MLPVRTGSFLVSDQLDQRHVERRDAAIDVVSVETLTIVTG